MTLLNFIGVWLAPFAAVANLAMVAVFLFEVRRAHQLHALLGSICVQAFANQHLPIWGPWGRVYGYALKITIVRVSDKTSDGEA